jgi:hypothetical protein
VWGGGIGRPVLTTTYSWGEARPLASGWPVARCKSLPIIKVIEFIIKNEKMNNEESLVGETQSEIPRKMEELKETFMSLHKLVSDLEIRLSSVLEKPMLEAKSASEEIEQRELTCTELGEKLEDLKCGAVSLERYISDIRKRIRL